MKTKMENPASFSANLFPGLCSVTFRSLSPENLIALCQKIGIYAVEWGGDVHLPPGNLKRARELAQRCDDAGIACPSYGSYFCCGASKDHQMDHFQAILDTTTEIGAQTIRVWAGDQSPTQATSRTYAQVGEEASQIAEMAKKQGIFIAFEFHQGTLTENLDSLEMLHQHIHADNVGYYWQPALGISHEEGLAQIQQLESRLIHVHAFHWSKGWFGKTLRHPLSWGQKQWSLYLHSLHELPRPFQSRSHHEHHIRRYVYLEFLKRENSKQLQADWNALSWMLSQQS